MSVPIKVFIAEDHPIFRAGLRQVLGGDSRMVIVGEAEDGPAALAQIKALMPHVALLDIALPQMDGLVVARALQNFKPAVGVVILTMCKEERVVNAALDRGVKGYVLKDNAVTDVINAIKAVAAGEIFLSPSISAFFLHRGQKAAALRQQAPGLESLTPTERRVLQLLAENKTSKQIGKELFISPHTVDTHSANIREKLDLHGTRRLLQFAIENRSQL